MWHAIARTIAKVTSGQQHRATRAPTAQPDGVDPPPTVDHPRRVADPPDGPAWRPRPGWGLLATVALLAGITVGALRLRGSAGAGVGLSSVVLVYLVAVVIIAMLGGTWPGIVAAVASDALLNWYFIPPYHTLSVEHRENLTALIVYILVAVTVSVLVNAASAQQAAAVRNGLEAQRLAAQAARAQHQFLHDTAVEVGPIKARGQIFIEIRIRIQV